MRYIILILPLLSLFGCLGYDSKDNESMGQVKKVVQQTPIICPDYTQVDISLGAMINGVGSMSKEDLWFHVENEQLFEKLKKAAETGKLVKISYNVRRVTFCVPDHIITKVELLETK